MHSSQTLRDQIKDKIAKGDVDDALRMLNNSDYLHIHDEVIALTSRYNTFQKQKNMQVISENDQNLESNRIVVALLDLVKMVESSIRIPSITHRSFDRKWIFGILSVLGLIVIGDLGMQRGNDEKVASLGDAMQKETSTTNPPTILEKKETKIQLTSDVIVDRGIYRNYPKGSTEYLFVDANAT
jgi:hypothetical protein